MLQIYQSPQCTSHTFSPKSIKQIITTSTHSLIHKAHTQTNPPPKKKVGGGTHSMRVKYHRDNHNIPHPIYNTTRLQTQQHKPWARKKYLHSRLSEEEWSWGASGETGAVYSTVELRDGERKITWGSDWMKAIESSQNNNNNCVHRRICFQRESLVQALKVIMVR